MRALILAFGSSFVRSAAMHRPPLRRAGRMVMMPRHSNRDFCGRLVRRSCAGNASLGVVLVMFRGVRLPGPVGLPPAPLEPAARRWPVR